MHRTERCRAQSSHIAKLNKLVAARAQHPPSGIRKRACLRPPLRLPEEERWYKADCMRCLASSVGVLLPSWPRRLRRRPPSISPTWCPIPCNALAACATAPPSALSFFELSTASLWIVTCKPSWRWSTLSILQTGRPLSTRSLASPRVTTIRAGSSVATRSHPSRAFGISLVTGGPCTILSPPCSTLAQMVRYITSKGLPGDSREALVRCCVSAPLSILGQGDGSSLARSRARFCR